MNSYIVEISNSQNHDWYYGMEGTRLEVYQGRSIYMVKQDYDNHAGNAPVRGIDFADCEKVCTTCNHIKSMHNTLGGFCKHCTCAKFKSRPTQHAPDVANAAAQKGVLRKNRSGKRAGVA